MTEWGVYRCPWCGAKSCDCLPRRGVWVILLIIATIAAGWALTALIF